ncbi:hypothetical protein BJV82DRAFT_22289 [Fennellomyces sp. T-0311]|nr:hypothetical protein BJV82DRAFT_22289 [Fennellomyces sp. T-0311]
MKHIRNKHFADCPPLSTSSKRLYRTPSGDVLHFNSESCRNTLEYGDEVIREFTDSAVRFYCPYQGCWAASKDLGYLHTHIRRKHYAAFPKSPRFIRINRTRNGKTLDFSEKGRNTVQDGDEILVDHLVDQDHNIPVNKGTSSKTDPKEAVSTTVASAITRKSSPNYAVIKEITKASVKESYTQTPLSLSVKHTIQEYARKRSYSC